jgi:transcription-repair coupling factor (superfamily II helicase)
VELAVSAFLPDSYVRGEAQRMEIYKRIAMIASEADRVALTDDLVDRFGEPPEPVVNLMNVAQLRSLARGIGADFVAASDGFLKFRLNGDYVDDPALLVSALAQADSKLSLATGRNTTVMLRLPRMADQDMIAEGIRALTSVAGLMQGAGNLPLSS